MKAAPRRALIIVISIVSVGYFALWACAPATTVRPNVPLQANSNMAVGAGASANRILRAPTSSSSGFLDFCTTGTCPAGHIWTYWQLSESFGLSAIAFAGQGTLLGAGLSLRYLLVDDGPLRISADLEGGFLWIGAALPISYRLSDDVAVYTNPSVGFRMQNAMRWPIGVAVDAGRFRLTLEAGVGATGRGSPLDVTTPSDLFLSAYGGVGAEVHF